MSQKENILQCQFIKKDGKLVSLTPQKYKDFVDTINEGQKVNVFMESAGENGTLMQISKIKVCIRALAKESGYTFMEMQNVVKIRTGFAIDPETDDYISFANCSKDELSLVLQTIIAIGDTLNVNCR